MFGTIPPPLVTNPGNTGSPNKVNTNLNDNTNNTGTNNVASNVVVEYLPQLLDSRRGSHVINVPKFNIEEFSSFKDRLANQDKRLKSIIILRLPNDVMKSVIKCTIARSIWNDLILAHEGPSDTKDTKIAALRLKFNTFKALEEKSGKGLVAESFDWNKEYISSEDEGVTKVKTFMAIAKVDPAVGKDDARSGQWVEITMKKVQQLISMNDGDERKHVLDYIYVDLHYVEDQRKNLLSKFNSLNQELSSCKSELVDLKDTKVQNISLQHKISRLNLDNESLRDEVSDLKKVIKK
nr:retrovirus-related Pol polyprotein from transposon TNT 1-94 [Tanacetum cinerariifolium]